MGLVLDSSVLIAAEREHRGAVGRVSRKRPAVTVLRHAPFLS